MMMGASNATIYLRMENIRLKTMNYVIGEFYVSVAVMNAAKDSLTSIGISTPSQLHNSTNPTCLSGLNPIKLL